LYRAQQPLGAKFVDFHGWELPVQFESILKEHQAVRTRCGLFDVSHMGQVWVRGAKAREFLDFVNANDIRRAKPGRGVYSHLLLPNGGVVDDVIAFGLAEDEFLVVVNAATADSDFKWLSKQAERFDVELVNDSDRFAMLALQGPKAAAVADDIVAGAAGLPRFGILRTELYGEATFVCRTGYTGEDGFEFILPNEVATRLWDNILIKGRPAGIVPCGLGARDTLRLEAGYLLYGQDLDETRTPLEAGYDWVVRFDKGDFQGKAALEKQKREGLMQRLTGFKLVEAGVPRPGCKVFIGGKEAGSFASATYSPSLKAGIGVAYVAAGLAAGTPAEVEVHGRRIKAEVHPTPFYKKGEA
jgi:aminomethyltransferase